jgi:nitroreductase
MEVVEAVLARRSISRLVYPGPSPAELNRMLRAAVAAPDHGRLRPWRFVVLEGEAKARFGEVLEDAYRARCQAGRIEPDGMRAARERSKLGRAPLVVVVAALRRPSEAIPWVEQLASAAAAAQNLLLAAIGHGYGTMWRTGEAAYDPDVKRQLGLTADDAIIGFLYIGTDRTASRSCPPERTVTGAVEWWTAP